MHELESTSIEIAITKTLRIQKKEDTKDKKNMLYIVVTQIDVLQSCSVLFSLDTLITHSMIQIISLTEMSSSS